ncbi:MAG: hypothetical protein V4527_18115 [Pseudomonadota bacterium]
MENENTSLDDILNGTPAVEAEAPAAEAAPVEAEAAPERPRDEHGRFLPKGEEQPGEPIAEAAPGASPAPSNEPPLEHPALIGERRRRQEAERQLEEYRQQANRQPPAPPPSIWDDEAAALQHFGGQVTGQAVDQAVKLSQINTSEMLMRQAHPDFQEMFDLFNGLAAENPTIVQQALSDPHPWNKAYQIARTHKTMQELGATDIDALKAKLREELQAEAVQAVAPATLPPTLSAERNAGARSGPAWSGPAPLGDILNS